MAAAISFYSVVAVAPSEYVFSRRSTVNNGVNLCASQLPKVSSFHRQRLKQKYDISRNRIVNSRAPGARSSMQDFDEHDEKFVTASVLEAVEVKSGIDGFLVKLIDGRYLRCAQACPQNSRTPDYASQPAIVLKVEDGSNILLPIIVLEFPSSLLMEAVRNVPMSRPTIYQVVTDMVSLMGYEVKLVRVTHRVCEAYYARVFLSKEESDGTKIISLDMRPSDAINLAVRAKVPVQVSKLLAEGDGVRIVSSQPRQTSRSLRRSSVFMVTDADRPETDISAATEEFQLVQLLELATQEERYGDAAKLRDALFDLRTNRKRQEQF
eukprot:TRINITY_DN973_c0_g1_i2.p1 TRINITY_DN973_c0_g1~~TRINITY_DN973_c0_g1_i2.p1  ORF type:complete len:341 (+),score=19.42 TRINITY_DN973_c0_g1_i2:55-1023(+)